MNTGDTIRTLRTQAHMTQAELAKRVNVAATTVSSWERGAAYPLMTTAKALAKVLGVKVSDIAGNADEDSPTDNGMHRYSYRSPTGKSTSLITIPDAIMGKWAAHDDLIATRITNQSMNKVIPEGSLIIVRKIYSLDDLDDCSLVAIIADGECSVMRFYKDVKHSSYVLQPDSTDGAFLPLAHHRDDRELKQIIGKVVIYMAELN